jgi:hypothetical protein
VAIVTGALTVDVHPMVEDVDPNARVVLLAAERMDWLIDEVRLLPLVGAVGAEVCAEGLMPTM